MSTAGRARSAIAVALIVFTTFSLTQICGLAPSLAYASSEPLAANASLVADLQANSTASNMLQPVFLVTPSRQTVVAGDYAKFEINISLTGTANVLLVARNVPMHSNAIFAPEVGLADPQFHSTLAIVSSPVTPAGNYNVTLVALVGGEEYSTYVNLQLTSNTTEARKNSTGLVGRSLSLGVDTDLHSYEANSTVAVRGHLSDAAGAAVAGAGVSVQVDDPTGAQLVLVTNITTDAAGIYQTEVKLGSKAEVGTYTVFALSFESGYPSATTRTTFVVGSSLTPSVVISQVYVTDTTGQPSGVFSAGQTMLVWVIARNNGAEFQGVIWVQILDPNGTPQSIQLQISALPTGAAVKVGFGFTASPNLPRGIYAANALVSDKLISQGGTFLASAKAEFALIG